MGLHMYCPSTSTLGRIFSTTELKKMWHNITIMIKPWVNDRQRYLTFCSNYIWCLWSLSLHCSIFKQAIEFLFVFHTTELCRKIHYCHFYYWPSPTCLIILTQINCNLQLIKWTLRYSGKQQVELHSGFNYRNHTMHCFDNLLYKTILVEPRKILKITVRVGEIWKIKGTWLLRFP